jgi:hypothetical protein
LEELIGALRLVPVDISFVVARFVESFRGMPLKNRAAKCGTFNGVAVAAPSHVAA